MAQAFVRVKGTEEWKPVTWSGQEFKADAVQLNQMLMIMRSVFANNEYEVRENDGQL